MRPQFSAGLFACSSVPQKSGQRESAEFHAALLHPVPSWLPHRL
jgi:hypothetical protein